MGYWEERQARTQAVLTEKKAIETTGQIAKYYAQAQARVIGQFQETYNKILSTIEKGGTPTPADLYKLDSYWKMQAQVAEELRKLGNRQASVMSAKFIEQYENIYLSYGYIDISHYTEIDTQVAETLINQIWCADGLSWSDRIWSNTELLQEELNNNLLDCLITGKSAQDLKILLQDRFNVSYARADALVRTELAHIQTQAARQRYTDAGITKVQVWADKDERRCEVCGDLHEKIFNVGDKMPVPAHPRCRCCIIPVIE